MDNESRPPCAAVAYVSPKDAPEPIAKPAEDVAHPLPESALPGLGGIMSLTLMVEMEFRQRPPAPARTHLIIIAQLFRANARVRFPSARRQWLTISPRQREKISVNLPLTGWVAACRIRIAVANHTRRESEWKLCSNRSRKCCTTCEKNR